MTRLTATSTFIALRLLVSCGRAACPAKGFSCRGVQPIMSRLWRAAQNRMAEEFCPADQDVSRFPKCALRNRWDGERSLPQDRLTLPSGFVQAPTAHLLHHCRSIAARAQKDGRTTG